MATKSRSSSISYTLLLYREELKRSDTRYMRLNRTKITLTDKLITSNVRNLPNYSTDEMLVINRELLFKKKLKYQMFRIGQLEKLGIPNANPNMESTEL